MTIYTHTSVSRTMWVDYFSFEGRIPKTMKKVISILTASAFLLIIPLILVLHLGAAISYSPSADRGVTCSGHPCLAAVTCPTSTCAATELQTALDSAWLGDTVTLETGKVWTTTGIVLHPRTSGSGTLTVRSSSADSLLPAPGTRITPLYKSLLPELRITSSSGAPIIGVEQTANPVTNITFMGIWFSTAPGVNSNYARLISTWVPPQNWYGVTGVTVGSPVTLTMAATSMFTEGQHVMVACTQTDNDGACGVTGVSGWWTVTNITPTTLKLAGTTGTGAYTSGLVIAPNTQYAATMTADNITIDRCLILPDPLSQIKNGVTVGGRAHTIKDSYFDHLKSNNDSQSISMPNAVGPVLITNNYLGGGSGENIVTGGAEPNVPNLHASDLTITHNTIYKDPALYKWETWSASTWVRAGKLINNGTDKSWIATSSGTTGTSQPTLPANACAAAPKCDGTCCVTDGTVVWQRNFLSSDWYDHWTVKNLFELKSAERVVARWNLLDGSWSDGQDGSAFLLNSTKQSNIGQALLQHIEFGDNVVRHTAAIGAVLSAQDYGDGDVDDVYLHDNLIYGFTGGWYALTIRGRTNVPSYFTGLRVDHNTFERAGGGGQINFGADGPGRFDGPSFTNNIFRIDGMLYPFISQAGTCWGTDKTALDCVTLGRGGYTFAGNILTSETLATWPARNFNPAWGSIGFTNVATADYSLGSSSPYKNAGTDGKDIGADTTQLPLIRHLAVTPTDRMALFAWAVTQPIQDIPCVIEVSTDRDFATYIGDLDPSLYLHPDTTDNNRLPKTSLDRVMLIGANSRLASATTYWYRLHCGGAFEQGSFTTTAPLSGGVMIEIAKLQQTGGTASFVVEWGTSYSRAADALSGGDTIQVPCVVGQTCSASFTVPAGLIAYYRLQDKDSAGHVLSTSPVSLRAQ
jgi:hypothetical protein